MFRDDTVSCPACGAALEAAGTRYRCGQCRSVLITDSDFGACLDEMSPDDRRPLDRRLFPVNGSGRTCALCTSAMSRHHIHHTELERCPAHGSWIEETQLQALLMKHGELYTERNVDQTAIAGLGAIPLFGVAAIAIDALASPWAKLRRLRKYLAQTTPNGKS